MKSSITKTEILYALATEPLQTERIYSTINCTVCAVGAVLRGAGCSNNHLVMTGYKLLKKGPMTAGFSTTLLLQKKKWLNALSVKFETMHKTAAITSESRLRLMKWVQKHF